MELPVLPDLSAVPFDRLDGTRLLDLDAGDLAALLRTGLPVEAFDAVHLALGVTASDLANAVGISPRTLARRRVAGRLAADESDRLLRTARLVEMALVALDDVSAAAGWMVRSHARLDGATPLVASGTDPGARRVEDLLAAIEFLAPA